MTKAEREKVADAIWKAVGTVLTNIRKHGFEFTSEDSGKIHQELACRLHASDYGPRGLDRYWERQYAFGLLGDVFWSWAISNKLAVAKKAVEKETTDDGEFTTDSLRKMEAYLVEHLVRDGLNKGHPDVVKRLGTISHVAEKS